MIETLNRWSTQALQFCWPMFWQSSLLIVVLLAMDWVLRRRTRAVVRYALWLVVLVKLIVPPSLAFPTGAGWWLRAQTEAPAMAPAKTFAVAYPTSGALPLAPAAGPPARASLSLASWGLICWGSVSLVLAGWMTLAWGRLVRRLRRANPGPPCLNELLAEIGPLAGWRRPVRLKVTEEPVSPAVCGLLRPTIVLPAVIATRLPAGQLRLVLLHELIHLRNRDIWVSCVQALLQIVYWWHPLLWMANARIRRAREEAVDDAVMGALRDEGANYASTLLEVARLAMERPLAALGLVGIIESKRALRERIERLLSFGSPRRAGLTVYSIAGIAAFSAIALPMGQAPPGTKAPNEAFVAGKRARAEVRPDWSVESLTKTGAANYDVSTGVLSASNGVRVTLKGAVLTADEVRLDERKGELVAKGLVQVRDGDRAFAAENLKVNANSGLEYAQAAAAPTLPVTNTNSGAGPGRVHTSSVRQAIYNKLSQIRLETVRFDDLPLSEVLKTLNDEAKRRDADGEGVNFILDPAPKMPLPAVDPATGQLVTPAPRESGLENVSIKLSLDDVRLVDVLDAIVKVADRRIQFTVETRGVVFRVRAPGASAPLPLFQRVLKVDQSIFFENVRRAAGLPASAPLKDTTAAFREMVARKGRDLSPPKAIFFDEKAGKLVVYASWDDLEVIETLANVLNQP